MCRKKSEETELNIFWKCLKERPINDLPNLDFQILLYSFQIILKEKYSTILSVFFNFSIIFYALGLFLTISSYEKFDMKKNGRKKSRWPQKKQILYGKRKFGMKTIARREKMGCALTKHLWIVKMDYNRRKKKHASVHNTFEAVLRKKTEFKSKNKHFFHIEFFIWNSY